MWVTTVIHAHYRIASMIKVRPQGICTEGLDRRPESKQTGKGEARTMSVLISATPIKCCRFERKHPACRGCKEDSRASLLMSHRFMQTKEMKKKNKGKSWERHPQPTEKPPEKQGISNSNS